MERVLVLQCSGRNDFFSGCRWLCSSPAQKLVHLLCLPTAPLVADLMVNHCRNCWNNASDAEAQIKICNFNDNATNAQSTTPFFSRADMNGHKQVPSLSKITNKRFHALRRHIKGTTKSPGSHFPPLFVSPQAFTAVCIIDLHARSSIVNNFSGLAAASIILTA